MHIEYIILYIYIFFKKKIKTFRHKILERYTVFRVSRDILSFPVRLRMSLPDCELCKPATRRALVASFLPHHRSISVLPVQDSLAQGGSVWRGILASLNEEMLRCTKIRSNLYLVSGTLLQQNSVHICTVSSYFLSLTVLCLKLLFPSLC